MMLLLRPQKYAESPEQQMDRFLFDEPLAVALSRLKPEERNLLVLRIFLKSRALPKSPSFWARIRMRSRKDTGVRSLSSPTCCNRKERGRHHHGRAIHC
ncbi:hypothetical protein ACFSQ7_44115 [Paenibacillus rhizoplanae]